MSVAIEKPKPARHERVHGGHMPLPNPIDTGL
jgi:hypothetical protein